MRGHVVASAAFFMIYSFSEIVEFDMKRFLKNLK